MKGRGYDRVSRGDSNRGDHVEDTVNVARAMRNFKRIPRKKSDFVDRHALFLHSPDPPGAFQKIFSATRQKTSDFRLIILPRKGILLDEIRLKTDAAETASNHGKRR